MAPSDEPTQEPTDHVPAQPRPPSAARRDRLGIEVLDHLLEGCQVIDREFRYVYVNEAACRHGRLKSEELLGRWMPDCYPGIEETELFEHIRRCMEARVPCRMENRFEHLDGSVGWFELRMVPVPAGVCVLSVDITEHKDAVAALARSEEQLRQAHKLEAVGRLAGGVAHDFNNILAAIESYAHLVECDERTHPALVDHLAAVRAAARRASDLTRQLLAYSRRQVLEPRSLDLRELLGGMESILRRLLRSDVELVIRHPPTLGRVWADPTQVDQIVLNLAVNAREAMPHGGRLTLETEDVEIDADGSCGFKEVEPGAYVMLRSTDTGTGFDAETAKRLFDPFFTTKAAAGGAGLGLSTVFGIVKQSQGAIDARSRPGAGAVFEVLLPRAPRGTAVNAGEGAPSPVPERGPETILLVEDDRHVSAATAAVLRSQGYRVLTAESAAAARRIAADHDGPIRLLLTDVILPGESGVTLAKQLAETRPEIAIVLQSGYAADPELHDGVFRSGATFLQKPVAPLVLLGKLREILG